MHVIVSSINMFIVTPVKDFTKCPLTLDSILDLGELGTGGGNEEWAEQAS